MTYRHLSPPGVGEPQADLPSAPPIEEHRQLEEGEVLGPFEILGVIGRGGVGTVYLAGHTVLKYKAALKVHEYFPESSQAGAAFLQSANSLSQLNHEYIVRLYDFGFQRNRAYVAMALVEGPRLSEMIPQDISEKWTLRAMDYAEMLISAVRYAHNCRWVDLSGQSRKGVLHGDIKPDNVLCSADGERIRLTDFMVPDLQRYLGQDPKELGSRLEEAGYVATTHHVPGWPPSTTESFGTPGYMSPEQEAGAISRQADIYSLGVTLFELFTGQPPLALKERRSLSRFNPFLPTWLDELVLAATEKDPLARLSSAAELQAAFLAGRRLSPEGEAPVVMGDQINFTNAGTFSVPQGQVFIGHFNELIAELTDTAPPDLTDALKMLRQAITISDSLSPEEQKELVEVVSAIASEGKKEQPNRTVVRAMLHGLREGVKAVPDVAKAIAAAEPILKRFLLN